MHLSLHGDFSLRVLIYLAVERDRLVTIDEIASAYGISKNHLVKVVHELGKAGFVTTIRGRNGGLRLAERPELLKVGEVVRKMERLTIAECFDPATDTCRISSACVLKAALGKATQAFLTSLNDFTIADLAANSKKLGSLLRPT